MKTCQANNCDYPVFSHNFCKTHQWMRKDSDYDARTPMQKYQDSLKKIKDRRAGDDLNKWFEMVAENISKHPYCMECGSFIPEKYYRAASAHILKKSIFISVATNPNNFLILGAGCGCHHAFDNGYMTEMKVFEEAIRRYNLFKDEVEEKHKTLQLFINQIT